jgi:hypothetical protein
MYAHPQLAAMLAQTRAADLRAAARGRLQRSGRNARFDSRPAPHASPVALDSYPRLCGLPVTIERLPVHWPRER